MKRSRIRARRSAGVFDHFVQATFADATARPTSSAEARATVFSTSPVAGIVDGLLRPDVPATRVLSKEMGDLGHGWSFLCSEVCGLLVFAYKCPRKVSVMQKRME